MTRRVGGRGLAVFASLALVVACGASPAPSPLPPSPFASDASPSVVASAAPSGSSPASASPAAIAGFRHVYLIVMENHEYGDIVGSDAAPFINSLIAGYGLATGIHAETHPSEPNYLALTSGGTQGVRDDGAYDLAVPSLFDQVEAAGRTWHVYAQGFPGSCSPAGLVSSPVDGWGVAGEYARKHNPAISYTAISRNPARCARITGLAGFDPGAADLELIVPNQANDMHSASIGTGDAFLRDFVPQITGSPAFAGSVLFITWDEGTTNDGGGGHVATIVVAPGMAAGARFTAAGSHYSILRTIEDAWGMPPLGGAATASPIPVGG